MIWLGFGMMYCGTLSTRSNNSAPPMMITATRAITAVSRCVRLPPNPNERIPAMLGSPASALRLNSGILSPRTLSTQVSEVSRRAEGSGDRDPRRGSAAAVDSGLDLKHAGYEIRLRLDLDRPRPGNVYVVDRRDAARSRRHDDDAVGKKDRLRNRVGNES